MWKTDRETDKQLNDWGHRGYCREGSWATDQGSPPSPAFSIKPRHTGNNLWTRPSNSPTPTQPQEPTSPVSQLHQTKPRCPHLTPDPRLLPHTYKTNLMSLMQKQICVTFITAQMHTHTPPHRSRSHVFTRRGQCLFFSTGSKVSNKKIQYSKCMGSQSYQYIIQKWERWQPTSRRKAIEFSVSLYPAASGCINLQLLIIELRRRCD